MLLGSAYPPPTPGRYFSLRVLIVVSPIEKQRTTTTMSKHSTQEQITSRSVLRHRPISPAASTDEAPLVPRASRGRSSQRHDTKQDTNTAPQPGSARQRRQHWLYPVVIGIMF